MRIQSGLWAWRCQVRRPPPLNKYAGHAFRACLVLRKAPFIIFVVDNRRGNARRVAAVFFVEVDVGVVAAFYRLVLPNQRQGENEDGKEKGGDWCLQMLFSLCLPSIDYTTGL